MSGSLQKQFHAVSLSGGKDSTAMLLLMIERGMPIDMVLYADTGMEFPEMYAHIAKLDAYRVLTDYFHFLRRWETQYAPQTPDDEWHPLFVEALQKTSYIEYLLDTLIDGSLEDRQALVAEQRNEVMKLEQRFAERRTEARHSRSQRKSGLDR